MAVTLVGLSRKAEKLRRSWAPQRGSRFPLQPTQYPCFTIFPMPPIAKSVIVGTAGHVDHGKTSLVKALTGIDADRLEEEKRRGITIDLGFAHLELPGANGEKIRLGFVDVPGHERFVRNMLAGGGGAGGVTLPFSSA